MSSTTSKELLTHGRRATKNPTEQKPSIKESSFNIRIMVTIRYLPIKKKTNGNYTILLTKKTEDPEICSK